MVFSVLLEFLLSHHWIKEYLGVTDTEEPEEG